MELLERLLFGSESLWGGGVAHSVMILALVIALGIMLGKVKVAGVSLGVTGILFVGIAFSYFGMNIDEHLMHFLKEFGLILFVYSIGLQVGPGFFSSFRKGGITLNKLAVLVVALGVVTTVALYYVTGLPMTTMVGVMSGAVTNTPGLGAAQQAFSDLHAGADAPDIATGYALAYPLGVIGAILTLLALRYLLRIDVRQEEEAAGLGTDVLKDLTTRRISVEICNPAVEGKSISGIRRLALRDFVVSRICRPGEAPELADAATTLRCGDRILLVAAPKDAEALVALLGREVDAGPMMPDRKMISRRILITKPELNGKTLAELRIRSTSGVTITRINRSGIDLVAAGNLQLQLGDRVTVVGPELSVAHAERLFGNSLKRLNHPNLIPIFIGIALGANVTIAHAIGEKNDTMVHHAVHTSIVVAVLGGLIAAVIGELFAVPLLNQLNVPYDVFPLALLYLHIYLAGLPVILLYNFEAAVFRSVGETKIPLIALTASGVLNVILNLFFVAALHMSVDGVAIATVLSNAVSAAILWGFLLKTDKVIRLEPKKLRIDGLCLRQILRIGVPAGVQSAMFSIANIVIQGAINSLGTVVMAASSAAYNIEVITYDILNSFSQACTTFVGQNFGAGKIRRCKKTLLLCLLEGIISLGVAIALILFFGKSLLTIFNGDPQVVETGYIRLMLIMPSHLFSLCYEVLSGYLRGFEISLPPAVLTMLGVCGVRLSWLRWVFPQYKTFMNIMLVFPISLAATALLMLAAVLYFRPSRRYAHLQKSDGAASAKIEG